MMKDSGMSLYASSVAFSGQRHQMPAMTARGLTRTLAMQLELPYEVAKAGGELEFTDGSIRRCSVSKPTGDGAKDRSSR